MRFGSRSLYAMLLGAGISVALGGYNLATGGEEVLTAALYLVAGAGMVYGAVETYREQNVSDERSD